jgi:glutamyl/glutaminyl-tRNA synthetase
MLWDYAARWDWRKSVDKASFDKVAALMQSRTKTFADAAAWKSFFTSDFEYDQKAFKKFLADQNTRTALEKVAASLEKAGAANESEMEKMIRDAETVCSIQQGKLISRCAWQ